MKIKDAAAWVKVTKNNQPYYSVKIELENGESVWVNLFQNKFRKDNPKAPDYKMIKEEQKAGQTAGQNNPPATNSDDIIDF